MKLMSICVLPVGGWTDIVDEGYKTVATIYTKAYLESTKEYRRPLKLGIQKDDVGIYDIVLDVPLLTQQVVDEQIAVIEQMIAKSQ